MSTTIVTVPTISAGGSHRFHFTNNGICCHELGNTQNVYFKLSLSDLGINPTEVAAVNGRASVRPLGNGAVSLIKKVNESYVRFDCEDDTNFWLEVMVR